MGKSRKKIFFLAWIVVIIAFILLSRFFYLQVFASGHLQQKVTEQRVKQIPLAQQRGDILDRNGNILAMSLMGSDIAVYPNLIVKDTHRKKVAKLVSDTLDLPYDDVLQKVSTTKSWTNIAKRVEPAKVSIIRDAMKKGNFGGIEITPAPKRYYPNGNLASSILGFVNLDSQPGAGIEVSMNSYLAGIPGYKIAETDNYGKEIPVGFENLSPAQDGQYVKLTLDNYMQYLVDTRLSQAKTDLEAISAYGIVMNPNTGEIYAMSSVPNYNPNNYGDFPKETWTNSVVNWTYEPGSIFKPIYMASALEAGAIDENSSWDDASGYITVNGTPLRNNNGEVYGHVGLKDIIVRSSNVGMVRISQSFAIDKVVERLKLAGFASKTGIELPGEEQGLFFTAQNLKDDPIRRATVSFGQGLSVTPLQIITAFSEVINGGYKVVPRIIDTVTDKNGNIVYTPAKSDGKERIYSQKNSDLVKSYLKENMEVGSGRFVQIEGYDGGAKTGTAWVVENGRYKDGAVITSFMGFAPFDNPEFLTLIVINQPTKEKYGSTASGPVWHDVMTEMMRYKSIPKKNQSAPKTIDVPNVRLSLFEDGKATLEKENPGVVVIKTGDGEVIIDQSYTVKNDILHVSLRTQKISDETGYHIPYLIGKSKEELQAIFEPYGTKYKLHGQGMIAEQSISPGSYTKIKDLSFWLK